MTAARGTGASTYNFVQGSETFVHLSTMFVQDQITMVLPSARMMILPQEILIFHHF